MFTLQRLLLPACVAVLFTTHLARAHSVWIEPIQDGAMVIRFAEPDGRFEKSPGYLDSLSVPLAFMLVTNAPVAVETSKQTNHFLLVGVSSTNTVGVETAFTVRAARKPFFYARWQLPGAGAGKPFLTLDIVPTGTPGEARVYLRGKPIGGVKATFRTPDDKDQELTADPEGLLRFKSNQSGQHMLSIAHQREPIAGFHLGQSYEQTSHNAALTWRQP